MIYNGQIFKTLFLLKLLYNFMIPKQKNQIFLIKIQILKLFLLILLIYL